jgi:hypothetical protein
LLIRASIDTRIRAPIKTFAGTSIGAFPGG